MTMKSVLVVLMAILATHHVYSLMTENQMKAALKLVRNVCQPKFKATNEEIEGTHTGNWDLQKSGKCYLWCILNMYKLMTKDNLLDWETALTTLTAQAPESIQKVALPALEKCKDSVQTPSDKCEAGYEIAHCIYLADPEHYFLP